MIKIGLADPYSLEYEPFLDLRDVPDTLVSPEPILAISPVRVKLEQWIGQHKGIVALICLVGLFAVVMSLRS